MDGRQISDDIESRFAAFVDGIVSVIGHADRAGPLRDYCIGLMMPGERKSVEPMAAVTAPERTAAQHQSLLHFVGQADRRRDRAPWRQAWHSVASRSRLSVCRYVEPLHQTTGPGRTAPVGRPWRSNSSTA